MKLKLNSKSSNKLYTMIDEDDLEKISSYKWHLNICDKTKKYVSSTKNGKTFLMHRVILNAKKDEYIDHINGNGLDNRKENLRICTNQQNSFNSRLRKNNTSGYKGVEKDKKTGKWRSYINFNKKIHLGQYLTKKEAALVYNNKAKELFGEFAFINNLK